MDAWLFDSETFRIFEECLLYVKYCINCFAIVFFYNKDDAIDFYKTEY